MSREHDSALEQLLRALPEGADPDALAGSESGIEGCAILGLTQSFICLRAVLLGQRSNLGWPECDVEGFRRTVVFHPFDQQLDDFSIHPVGLIGTRRFLYQRL